MSQPTMMNQGMALMDTVTQKTVSYVALALMLAAAMVWSGIIGNVLKMFIKVPNTMTSQVLYAVGLTVAAITVSNVGGAQNCPLLGAW